MVPENQRRAEEALKGFKLSAEAISRRSVRTKTTAPRHYAAEIEGNGRTLARYQGIDKRLVVKLPFVLSCRRQIGQVIHAIVNPTGDAGKTWFAESLCVTLLAKLNGPPSLPSSFLSGSDPLSIPKGLK
jgi:hypothetical protein